MQVPYTLQLLQKLVWKLKESHDRPRGGSPSERFKHSQSRAECRSPPCRSVLVMASSMSAVLKEKACRAMYRSCKGRGRVTLLTPSFSFRALISHSFQSRGSDTTDNSKNVFLFPITRIKWDHCIENLRTTDKFEKGQEKLLIFSLSKDTSCNTTSPFSHVSMTL